MATTILVTGATGTIGSQVVAALNGLEGVTVRAGLHNASKSSSFNSGNVSPVYFDFNNPDSIQKALNGVDKLFLVTPGSPDQVDVGTRVIDLAKAAGVKHVVKLSAIGSDNEPGIQLGRWHRTLERYIVGSGLKYTFLRPNSFMENFINFYPPAKDGNIYLPWGQGACSFIAGSDIASVAAAVLTQPGHENKAYALTGPKALTIAEAAAILSEGAGRKIGYVNVQESVAKDAMSEAGMPKPTVDALAELHAINKAGYAAEVTDSVRKLTGRDPMDFKQFVWKNAIHWK